MIPDDNYLAPDFDAAALRSRVDDDVAFIREILGKSIPTLKARIDMLNEAWYKRELNSIHDKAHSIKGLAQMLSFDKLSLCAQKMEKESRFALNSGAAFYDSFSTNPDLLEDALNRAEQAYLESELAP